MPALSISQLYTYPLKSARGQASDHLQLAAMGPQHDRRWMVVDDSGQYITQRQLPRLCLISATVNRGYLTLEAAGYSALVVDSHQPQQSSRVSVWDDIVDAWDCGDKAADWLSHFLATPCRLVFMPDHCQRWVDTDYARNNEIVSFADAFPLLLISEASLDDLNTRLSSPIAMNRFRPNIVVRGCEPFAEDTWRSFRVGDLQFSVVKACSRCVIPCIDPETGEKQGQINRVLASFRRRDGAIFFGQNLLCEGEGVIRVGDTVDLL